MGFCKNSARRPSPASNAKIAVQQTLWHENTLLLAVRWMELPSSNDNNLVNTG